MENNNLYPNQRLRFAISVFYFILLVCAVPLVLSGYEGRGSHCTESSNVDSMQLQTFQELIQALKPGNHMPEAFWDMPMELDNFRGEKIQYTYGDMRGRVIIFDFWSTTCKSCIENIPHLSEIQDKYPDDLAIILVNSKRNRDTPRRINATMKRYKEQYNFDISLFTILDDTLLTTLFPHNAIPSTAWISPDGIYMGNTMSDEVNSKNIESVIKGGKVNLPLVQVYRNFEDRNNVPPLRDTIGEQFISEITAYNPFYLPTYPNVLHKDGHSSYQMVNNSFSFILSQAYRKELDGMAWNDYVFDSEAATDFKYKLLNAIDNRNTFSYQLYVRDSINQLQAEAYLREAFEERFKLNVERRQGEIPVYQVHYNPSFEKIKTKGEMTFLQPYPGDGPEQYRNIPISRFLTNLFYYLDRPLVFDQNDNQSIDLIVPADFGQRTMAAKLSYLAELGIELIPARMNRDYVYISPLK